MSGFIPPSPHASLQHGTEQSTDVNLEDGNTKMTTTKFTASASPHENNVFVVEVQQGGATRSSDTELYLKLSSSAVSSQEDIDEEDSSRRSSSQRAQVHRPPDIDVDEVSDEDLEDIEDDEEDEDTTERNVTRNETVEDGHDGSMKTNTGLSQSDLSISSSGSNNPSYRYGNQVGYEGGHFGYPQYAGYAASDGKAERNADGGRLAVPGRNTSVAIAMKRASSVNEGNDKISNLQMSERYSIDVTTDSSRLLSDIQAIERRQQEEDLLQEEQRQLGNGTGPLAVANGDTTPSPVNEKMAEDNQDDIPTLHHTGNLTTPPEETYKGKSSGGKDEVNSKPETEVNKSAFELSNEKFDGDGVSEDKKRGSLKVITPELYTQIKQTTKSLILDKASRPGLSPKFEKFHNENSPLDERETDVSNDASQPTDTAPIASQEYENEAFVSSDRITS